MRSTGVQGDRNPKGTYLPKSDLMIGLAQRRAKRYYRPMKPIKFIPQNMKKK